MTSDNDLDKIVEQYLERLSVALGGVRHERRQQLMGSIKDHIREARSTLSVDSEAALRDILDRVGRPEDIAAEAFEDRAASTDTRTTRFRRAAVVAVAAVVVAGLTVGAVIFANSDKGLPATTASTTTTIAPSVTIPNVIGEPLAKAENQLMAERLIFTVSYKCSRSLIPPGTVTSQSPTPGTRSRSGSDVVLTAKTHQTCH
jgi:hypothetical protein